MLIAYEESKTIRPVPTTSGFIIALWAGRNLRVTLPYGGSERKVCMETMDAKSGKRLKFSRYITTKDGRRIYPVNGKCFCFPVDDWWNVAY